MDMKVSSDLKNFIDEEKIFSLIAKNVSPDPIRVKEVIAKASEAKGLSQEDVAILMQNEDKALDELMLQTAKDVKTQIYGKRMVLFAPLYVSNECQNNCTYCGFAASNKDLLRKTLSQKELRADVEAVERMGHKRLLLVYGETNDITADRMVEDMKTVYDTKTEPSGEIRRVNINCAPLDVDGYRKIKEAGVGTYQCFQETYHQATYNQVHTGGKKRDYLWRLYALHRAQEAGLDDVATGALFGLYDYKFEMIALLQHAEELERAYGCGPHTISFPRLEPALGAEISYNPPYPVDDYTFKKLVAILRLAVPYTGLILSTREPAELRRELLQVGVSQLSAASRTYPGAYSNEELDRPDEQQFSLGDDRPLDDVIYDMLTTLDYVPSFCTGCYRRDRTGHDFMGLAKTAFIKNHCQPNALVTFLEYLNDYASEKTKAAGKAFIKKELGEVPEKRKGKVQDAIDRTEEGERDLFF